MALEQQVMQQQEAPMPEEEEGAERLTPEEEDDLAIAVTLAQNIIDDGGIQVIDEAMNSSSDPAEVIGQFLMQLVAQMSEQLPEEVELSPRVFLAQGGWVEQVSDYLQEDYDIPREVMDRAEMFIAAQADSMAQGAMQQQEAQQQQLAQPAMPQQGGMV